MTEKLKPLAPYAGYIITVAISVIGGWNAMNLRMAETDGKIKVLEMQMRNSEISEKKHDEKLESFQNTYVSTIQQIAIINTKLDMILEKTRK